MTAAAQHAHDLSRVEAVVWPAAAAVAVIASAIGYVVGGDRPSPGERRFVYATLTLLFVAGVAASIAVDRACDGFHTGSATRTWIGNALAVIAAVWIVFATVSLGKDFSGGTVKEESGLRRELAFALVRHPLYLGWLLLVLAAAATLSSAYLLAFLPLLALAYWQARQEERALTAALAPGAYARHRRRTRAKIFPGDQLLHP